MPEFDLNKWFELNGRLHDAAWRRLWSARHDMQAHEITTLAGMATWCPGYDQKGNVYECLKTPSRIDEDAHALWKWDDAGVRQIIQSKDLKVTEYVNLFEAGITVLCDLCRTKRVDQFLPWWRDYVRSVVTELI